MGCHWVVGANSFALLAFHSGFDSGRLKSPLQSAGRLLMGGYVSVMPQEIYEDFDLEQSMQDIHLELTDLNHKAFELVEKIQTNYGDLGL